MSRVRGCKIMGLLQVLQSNPHARIDIAIDFRTPSY